MRLPTLHLNGTSGEALRDQYLDAYMALERAIEILTDAAPNARDYYPQGSTAFNEAQQEHAKRLASLRSVREDLSLIADHVQEQLDQTHNR